MPLSNLRGSRMARADVCSLPLANNAMHSTTIIVFVGRGRQARQTVRYAGFFSTLKSIGIGFTE